MPKVQKLSEELIRHIAAGEVVERPAAVLKELLENALDAGAGAVTVSWEDAGRKSLRVSDDGCGMAPEDARLALERNATSKIASLDDLQAIGTYGFRGEALPSIAAVSRFRLTTRTGGAAEAWALTVEGGNVLREGPEGAPPGTTVTVEDLFFNTPARLKFLKSDATEKGLLLRVVEDAALAARRVDFRVFSDGKEVLDLRRAPEGTDPSTALKSRLAGAWGEDRARALKPVRAEGRPMTVWGWISDVHAHESTARFQRLYVNGRPVTHRRLLHALYDAYKGRLFVGRHPAAALFIEINPALVDVNVHPSKREVRFSNESEVHDFVSRSLREALSGSAHMPSVGEPSPHIFEPSQETSSGRPSWGERRAVYALESPPPLPGAFRADRPGGEAPPAFAGPTSGAIAGDDAPMSLESFRDARFEALAQFDATYILTRSEDRFYIFDQHAAAERSLYERLQAAAVGGAPLRQALLLPWVWEVPAETAAVIHGHLEDLSQLGYDLEPFGNNAFRVKAVPGVLGDSNRVRELLEGLVDDLLTEKIPGGWDVLLIRASCRGSVKAGDTLQLPEMSRILKDLQACKSPWSCPHGRPTFLKLDPAELARRFRRT